MVPLLTRHQCRAALRGQTHMPRDSPRGTDIGCAKGKGEPPPLRVPQPDGVGDHNQRQLTCIANSETTPPSGTLTDSGSPQVAPPVAVDSSTGRFADLLTVEQQDWSGERSCIRRGPPRRSSAWRNLCGSRSGAMAARGTSCKGATGNSWAVRSNEKSTWLLSWKGRLPLEQSGPIRAPRTKKDSAPEEEKAAPSL